MHELLVSFLIISLTMLLLCSWKVKRLALKEKKNQYVASVYWMQRLKQILQWQLYREESLDFSKVLVSHFGTANTGVTTGLDFDSEFILIVNGILYFFAWRWLLTYSVAVFIFKLFYEISKLNASIRCRNTSIQDYRALVTAVYLPITC